MTKDSFKLLVTGFVQVALVSCNTYQIAHKQWIGIFVVGFLISLVWSWNVKKICLSTIKDRLIYCTGAAMGSVVGCLLADVWYSYVKFNF
jgi:hypothetical protein